MRSYIKTISLFTIVALLFIVGCKKKEATTPNEEEPKAATLSIVDKNATAETKALLSNLWAVQQKGTMFGHHEGLLYGRNWMNEPNRSDVKEVCGDFPAVNSFDFSKLENGSSNGINGVAFDDVRRVTQEAYRRGEVSIYAWHADNPLTGGDSWDNSNTTVAREILTEGSATNLKFKTWLDKIADFSLSLKGDNNELIPIIFRPFHEHTQEWNWWGKKCTTEEEFIGLWRFTVEYLRDTKDVHNLIYAISPQVDSALPASILTYRYPGDDYVDFLGIDAYHGSNADVFASNLVNLSALSNEKMKPCGVTEIGIEGVMKDGVEYADYWSEEILVPMVLRDVSMVVLWRNQYDPSNDGTHFYGPVKGHASESDFKHLYKTNTFMFSQDLPNMYTQAVNIKVE